MFVPSKVFLAIQLLSCLSPKQGAAALSREHSSPNALAAPLRVLCIRAMKNRHSRKRHYGFDCSSYKEQLEHHLRHTEPGLPALRRKHDGISLSWILWQRLAAGVGAGNPRRVEEWKTEFWQIVRKASSVDQRRADGTFNERDERHRANQ